MRGVACTTKALYLDSEGSPWRPCFRDAAKESSLKARKIRPGLRLEDQSSDGFRKGDERTKDAEPLQLLSDESSSNEDSISPGDLESGSVSVDMPLIRLPKIRRKQSSAAGGEGDAASLASAMSASSNSIKSLGLAGDDVGYSISKVKDLPKLHRAVWKCNMHKVKTATKGIKTSELNAFDKGRRTALHLACAKAHKEIIIHLCSLHANVNLQDGDGATPMHKLIETKNTECLSTLIACGGNTNLTDKFGQSPLHFVAKIGDVEASILLLEGDAVVDATDKNGMTALHIATLNGHRKLAASLIADGFFVDAQDGQGRTSLMIAAAEGRIGLVKLLSENKADPEMNDSNMFKAIDYAVTRNQPECARLLEEHEKEMERERQLEAKKPRRASLVDPALIEEYYGPPSLKRKDSLSSGSQATPTKTTPTKVADDTPIKDAEDAPRETTPINDPWADSESEEEDLKCPSSKVNLRAALEQRASLKSIQTTPTNSTQHYKLPTKGETVDETKAPLDHRDSGSESDESIEQALQPKEFAKTTAEKKLEATLLASRQEGSGTGSAHGNPVKDTDVDTAAIPQPMEKVGGNLPQIPGGAKVRSAAFSLSPKKADDKKVATPLAQGRVGDHDDDFDSDESDIDAIPEEMSDDEEESDDGEPGYNLWMSFGGTSSMPGSRRVSPFTSPLTSPIHEGYLQTPTKKAAISPLTKSIRSMTPPTSQTELTTKTPSTSVDIGGKGPDQKEEGSEGLLSVLSSATDQVPKNDGGHYLGEEEKGASLNVRLSSAADQPSSQNKQNETKLKGSSLAYILSSSTDQGKGSGLASCLSSATDQEKGSSLTSHLSSSTDQPLKKGASLPSCQSSSTDQPLKKGAGLPSCQSSATDQPLTRQVEEVQGASLVSFPSSATDPPVPVTAASATRSEVINRDDSLEGLLTQDEEVTDSEDEDDYDYVEEIIGTAGYVPSDPTLTPKRREVIHTRSGSLSSQNKEENVSTVVSPKAKKLGTTQQTPTKESSTPSQQVATPISDSSLVPVSPLSAGLVISEFSEAKGVSAVDSSQAREEVDDFSDIIKSDDDDEIEKLLGEAEELSPMKMTAAKKKEASELFASVIKAAEEKETAENLKEREAVDDIQQPSSEQPQKQEDVLDIEAQYEDSEWDSEDESEGESNNEEEEEGDGTALAWLSNSGLADPFVSPLTSPTHSRPTSPRKARPQQESTTLATATPSPATAVVSSSDVDRKEVETERKEMEIDEPGHPLVRKVTTTHLSENKGEEDKRDKEDSVQSTAALVDNEEGHPLVRKVTVTHLQEKKGGEKGEISDKNEKVHSVQSTAAVNDNEAGHPLERKVTVTHLPENKKEKRDKREELVQPTAATVNNKAGHPLEYKGTITHLPEEKKMEAILVDSLQPTLEPVRPTISPTSKTAAYKPVGGVGRRGFIGRVRDGDDTEDDAATLTNTDSEASPIRSPRIMSTSPPKQHTPPISTILTPSQLHSSPLRLHHLTLSPVHRNNHGAMGGATTLGGGINLFGRQSTLSEPTSPAETQEPFSEASDMSDDLPLGKENDREKKETMKVKKPQEDAAALAKAVGGDKGQEIVKEKAPTRSPGTSPHKHPPTSTPTQLHSSPMQLHHLTLSPTNLEAVGGLMGWATTTGGGVNPFGRQSSLSEPTSPAETQESQEPLSEASKLSSDDLPLGPLTRLNQSLSLGGALFLNSTHTAQLQESLHETRRSLDRSNHAQEVSERSRRQLEAKLEDFQRRYDEVVGVKHNLENHQLGLEHEVRELRYRLEQAQQDLKSKEEVNHKLQDQLSKMESRLTRETEGREAAELRRRELEIAHTGLTVSYQHLEEMVSELKSQLQVEKEAKQLQDTLSKEQLVQFQLLQSDSQRAEDQRSLFLNQLQAADATKQSLEERLVELKALNTQLEVAKTTLEGQTVEQQQEVQSLRIELEKTKEELTKTTGQLEKSMEEQDRTKGALEKTSKGQEVAKEELEKIRREVSQLEVEVERRKGEQKMTKDELDRTQREMEITKRELEKTKSEEEVTKRELEKTRREANQFQVELEMRKGKQEMGDRELEAAKGEGEVRKGELEKTRRALNQLQIELEMRKGELERTSRELSHTQTELEVRRGEEERTKVEMETTKGELEVTRRELQQHQIKLEKTADELVRTSGELERVKREATEARQLFENEVRSKSKLITDLEKSQVGSSQAVDKEKRRTRKALDLKKSAELNCRHLQEQGAKLQAEVASLRSQLKEANRHIHQLEMSESQMKGEFDREKAELEREQTSSEREATGLKRLLESTQQQLKKEVELRHKVEQDAGKAKQDMEVLQKEAALKQKELSKVEKLNKKLHDELQSLNVHMTTNMVSKTDLELYKRAVNEKARQELSLKLEQVNAHLEQQSQTQEALDHLRSTTESEWKQKYERTSEEMRSQLGQARSDRESLLAVAARYKELYECEHRRAEKLNNRLLRTKEEAIESETRLSRERLRNQQLLNMTQSGVSGLSPPQTRRNVVFTTSTPANVVNVSPSDELLSSARAELDKSVTRHLDMATVPISTATRSTYKSSSPELSSKYSHLESIKRNYRI